MKTEVALGAICGAMTSTPGLGVLQENVPLKSLITSYASVYPFALIGMIIFVNFL